MLEICKNMDMEIHLTFDSPYLYGKMCMEPYKNTNVKHYKKYGYSQQKYWPSNVKTQ